MFIDGDWRLATSDVATGKEGRKERGKERMGEEGEETVARPSP